MRSKTGSRLDKTMAWSHDARYRLLDVNSTDNTLDRSYTYDRVGDRKTPLANVATYYYCHHASDCCQGPNSNLFKYDANDYCVGKTDSHGEVSCYLEGEHVEAVYKPYFSSYSGANADLHNQWGQSRMALG